MKTCTRLCLFLFALAATCALRADIPKMIHYQGFVTDATAKAFTGNGHFKFALVDQAGTTTYWNFDGSATAGGAEPPGAAVRLGVLNGLFSVLLGDTTVPNMNLRIDPGIFADHSQVYLRLWFSDLVGGPFVVVTPDSRIVSVGYAMVADRLADGSISGPELSPSITLGGVAGKGELTVKSAGDLTRAVLDAGAAGGGGILTLLETDGVIEGAKLVAHEAGKGGGQLVLKNASGQTTVELDGQDGTSTTAGALVNLKKGDGARTVSLQADIGSGQGGVLLFTADGAQETIRLTGAENGTEGGFLGLKNESGNGTIQLDAQDGTSATAAGSLRMRLNNETTVVELKSDLGFGNGALLMFDGDGSETVRLTGAQDGVEGALFSLKNENGDVTIQLDAQDGVDATAPAELRLKEVDGTITAELSNEGSLKLSKGDGTLTAQLKADIGSGNGGLLMYDPSGGESIRFTGAFQGTGAGFLQFKNLDGVVVMTLNGDSEGEGKLTTQVIEITGGADLSEQFNIAATGDVKAEPGMIVCIDPDRPGELRVSDRPYDSTVAGIISGAGGVKPGMLMGQPGTLAHGQHPVALTGRVYCRVDARHGAVKPGDLITTSATPGHGMKADSARAAGAIIGKAMTPLKEGEGLVLVLVSLQ